MVSIFFDAKKGIPYRVVTKIVDAMLSVRREKGKQIPDGRMKKRVILVLDKKMTILPSFFHAD